MWSKGHVRGNLREEEGRKTEVLQGIPEVRIFPEPGGCYMLPNQARYQTSLNPDDFSVVVKHVVKGPCSRDFARGTG